MDALALADWMGVHIRYFDGLTRWGYYDHDTRTILLSPGMPADRWRTTIFHELGHAYWEHRDISPRTERQADRWAARTLIPPPTWAWATGASATVTGIADLLGVLPRLVMVAHAMYDDYTPQDAAERELWARVH